MVRICGLLILCKQRSSTVRAQVLDVNDNSPVFERSHERHDRLEDSSQRSFSAYPLTTVRASDVDAGANGSVRCDTPPAPKPEPIACAHLISESSERSTPSRTDAPRITCAHSFSLVVPPGANRFAIGENSGVITVLAPLDREQQESISLLVLASDRGTPARTSTATVSEPIPNHIHKS